MSLYVEVAGVFLQQLLQHCYLPFAPRSERQVFIVNVVDLSNVFFHRVTRLAVIRGALSGGKGWQQ
jgi:hypothetical protein